jgi:hypothetical protein
MGVTFFVWSTIGSQQPMWAFPALYLIEMLVLCALVLIAATRGITASALLAWMAAGAVLAFSGLAMFSIGMFYVPVAALLALVGIFAALRTRTSALTCAAWAVLAALAQVGIVYIVVLLRA